MKSRAVYIVSIVVVAVATFLVTMLLMNVSERQQEGRQTYFPLAPLSEDTVDPAEWGKNFPRQYDGYKRTVDTARTKYGGSEAFQRLDLDPKLRRIFGGYAFSIDVKAARAAGATDAQLGEAFRLQRKAQFRADFVNAENSMGFHAPQEAARILGEAIDYARQGQLVAARLRK